MKLWLDKTSDGKFAIEHIPCPHPAGNLDYGKPPAGVLHTTEGSWSSALSVFRQHYAPTFLCGSRKIAQLVPLGQMTAALENAAGGVETNRWARVQIEVVGHSKETPYSFDGGTTDALASLLATCNVECGIPLTRPYSDAMPKPPWATQKFYRRHDGKWGHTAGWFGHVEIPENSHWDPGYLRWTPLLVMAESRLPKKPHKGGHWQVTTITADGHGKETEVSNLGLWVVKQGNLAKKGVRDVQAHWVS